MAACARRVSSRLAGSHDYAILGTELWLLQGDQIQSLPIGRSGMREVHGNRAYLHSVVASDIVEQG